MTRKLVLAAMMAAVFSSAHAATVSLTATPAVASANLTWTVSNGDKVELTLKIGKAAPDGRSYAIAGTSGMVALLGKPETAKLITRYIDNENKVFEMHMPVEGQAGKWWKMMETTYKRRK